MPCQQLVIMMMGEKEKETENRKPLVAYLIRHDWDTVDLCPRIQSVSECACVSKCE